MRRIIANEEVCMGCGLCEIHCLIQHSSSKDIIKAFKKENPRPISRIRLEKFKPVSFAIQCQNCENPPCVMFCLSGAMQIDSKKAKVIHNQDKCIDCLTCVMVCPYGAVIKESQDQKFVAKCDLCSNLDTPTCVANCPNEALSCEEIYV